MELSTNAFGWIGVGLALLGIGSQFSNYRSNVLTVGFFIVAVLCFIPALKETIPLTRDQTEKLSILIIGAIGFLVFSSLAWMYFRHGELSTLEAAPVNAAGGLQQWSRDVASPLDRTKVKLFLARADGYRGGSSVSSREEDMHRHIDSSEPFIIKTNKKSFAFGIDNANEIQLLNKARITLLYLGQPPLSITRTHTDEPGHFWNEYNTGTHYFYEFHKPINGGWDHSWGALNVEFPTAGEYRFDFEITSNEITSGHPIRTYLRVIVAEEAFKRPHQKTSIS